MHACMVLARLAGETFVIKSLVWYCGLLVLTFLITGTKRTQGGRFWSIVGTLPRFAAAIVAVQQPLLW